MKRFPPGDELFSSQAIHYFQIQIAPDAWEQLRRTNRMYVRATLTLGTNVFRDVGVRLKGHGSFRLLDDRPSLSIKLDEFVPGQKLDGLTRILLNNASQDPTLLSEYVAAGMFRDANVPVARVSHARVQLNSRDLGFYVLAEGMNKVFLKQHFKNAAGNLYEVNAQDIDEQLVQTSGQATDKSDLAALVAAAKLPAAARVNVLPDVLDVDGFLSLVAVSVLAAHHDSYPLNRNNYRLYNDPESKRFSMIPHGIDGSFQRTQLSIELQPSFMLTKAILETPEFAKACRARTAALFTHVFDLEKLTNRIDIATRRLQNAAVSEEERAGISLRSRQFTENVIERHKDVADQLAGIRAAPLQLSAGTILPLTNWKPEATRGAATFDRPEMDGREVLHIRTGPVDTLALWQHRLLLAPGSYRLLGNARCATGNRTAAAFTNSALIRIFTQWRTVGVPATDSWVHIEFPFVVRKGEEDVLLTCECFGADAEAWFDLESFRLKKE